MASNTAFLRRCHSILVWWIVCAHSAYQWINLVAKAFQRQRCSGSFIVVLIEISHLYFNYELCTASTATVYSVVLQFVCLTRPFVRGDYYINETIARLFISFEHIGSNVQLANFHSVSKFADIRNQQKKIR